MSGCGLIEWVWFFLSLQINLHGYDFDSLHVMFKQEHLPSEIGGPLPSMDSFSAARLFDLQGSDSHTLEQEPVPEPN